MHPDLFKFGALTIHSYGVMMALAFSAGIAVSIIFGKREGLNTEKVFDGVLWVMISSIIGARVFYVVEFWENFKDTREIFMLWQGGLVFYGGLTFAIAALIVWSKKNKLSVFKILDIAAPAAALGYAIGRIGCFLNGCCYGVPADLPWAAKFPNLIDARHPTQLYSSFSGLDIFLALIILYNFKKFDGQIFSLGLIFYSVYRFFIEFFRENPRYILGLSEAQLISIGLFLLMAVIYAILYRKATKNGMSG